MAKKALVTGSTRGIGKAILNRLKDDGFDVIGVARNTPESFPGHFYKCDLDDIGAAMSTFRLIVSQHEVSVLVNNVGAVAVQATGEITPEALSHQWRVNVEATVMAIQAFVPAMKILGGGRVINIASGAVLGKMGRTGYSASKAALLGLTRTMAMELGQDGITVNCIAPGQIHTELWAANNNPESAKTRAMVESIPLRRLGRPEDVAGAAAYFASDAADYVTGQTLYVCGGLTVGRSPS